MQDALNNQTFTKIFKAWLIPAECVTGTIYRMTQLACYERQISKTTLGTVAACSGHWTSYSSDAHYLRMFENSFCKTSKIRDSTDFADFATSKHTSSHLYWLFSYSWIGVHKSSYHIRKYLRIYNLKINIELFYLVFLFFSTNHYISLLIWTQHTKKPAYDKWINEAATGKLKRDRKIFESSNHHVISLFRWHIQTKQ